VEFSITGNAVPTGVCYPISAAADKAAQARKIFTHFMRLPPAHKDAVKFTKPHHPLPGSRQRRLNGLHLRSGRAVFRCGIAEFLLCD